MRPKRDITGNYMRLRMEFIKEYLACGCDIRTAITYADEDMRYADHLGTDAIDLLLWIPTRGDSA